MNMQKQTCTSKKEATMVNMVMSNVQFQRGNSGDNLDALGWVNSGESLEKLGDTL